MFFHLYPSIFLINEGFFFPGYIFWELHKKDGTMIVGFYVHFTYLMLYKLFYDSIYYCANILNSALDNIIYSNKHVPWLISCFLFTFV